MSNTALGLLTGLILGIAAVLGGFGAFLLVLVLGAIGLGIGRFLDGQIDLDGLTGRRRN